MCSLQQVEAHPLFPVLLHLADLAQQAAGAMDDPAVSAQVVSALDNTRLLHKTEYDTGNDELDEYMVVALVHFRLQLKHLLEVQQDTDSMMVDAGNSCGVNDNDNDNNNAWRGGSVPADGAGTGGNGTDSQQRGHALPPTAVEVLKRWLERHVAYAYPDADEKKRLAEETGLTVLQVNYWFTNARRRILPKLAKDASNLKRRDLPADVGCTDEVKSWFMSGRN